MTIPTRERKAIIKEEEEFKGLIAPYVLFTENAVVNILAVAKDIFNTVPYVMSEISGYPISPKVVTSLNNENYVENILNLKAKTNNFLTDFLDVAGDFFDECAGGKIEVADDSVLGEVKPTENE